MFAVFIGFVANRLMKVEVKLSQHTQSVATSGDAQADKPAGRTGQSAVWLARNTSRRASRSAILWSA
jgi:hypothetical protein